MPLAKISVAAIVMSPLLTGCLTTGFGATDGKTLAALAAITARPPSAALPAAVPCASLRPIAWSKSDTRRTQEETVEYNAVWKAVCGSAAK